MKGKLNKRIEQIEDRYDKFRNTKCMANVCPRILQENVLHNQIEELEQYGRRTSLRFHYFPMTRGGGGGGGSTTNRFHTPGTSGADAFAFNWAGENNWLVPPLNLVNRVIRHCLACGAFGTLVVPKWESSPFWPVIFHSNSSCMHYISDVLEFKDLNDIYIYGSNKKSLFGSERFKSSVLVIRISPL